MIKITKTISAVLLIAGFLAAPYATFAADAKSGSEPPKKAVKAKPYLLKTCVVSDEALGGTMGEPYVFTYKGQEIKMCCKDCRKEFDKNPAKFMKKLEAAQKKHETDKK
jgi:hypothetical protein